MTVQHKFSSIAFLSIVAFILSACGAAPSESVIATRVAQTVQAQDTHRAETAEAATPTDLSSLPTLPPLNTAPALTPGATKAPPTPPPAGNNQCTAEASFVSETIPDGTIMSPGQQFTKTWTIKNTGTCPWNSNWKFVYFAGDLLGASTSYNIPVVTRPGETVSMSPVLVAPQANGSYEGDWKLQSPWNLVFGDSSGYPYSVKIVVGSTTPENNKTQTVFGITNVTIDVARSCTTANTFYTITASLSSNGPVTAVFTWVQSDGNNRANNKLTFPSAMTKTATREWSQNISSSQTTRWVQVIITSPAYQEWPQVTLPPLCNQQP